MRRICLSLIFLTACQASTVAPGPLPEAVTPIIASHRRVIEAQMQACLHNIANVDTCGFKASHVVLTDITNQASLMPSLGSGVAVAGLVPDMRPGVLEVTGRTFDLAIRGRGFFQVRLPDGSKGYTRCGQFLVNAHGRLVTQAGYLVLPEVWFPQDLNETGISSVGRVRVLTASCPDSPILITTLQIARFVNPDGLRAKGGGLFLANTDVSGFPIVGAPGNSSNGHGELMQGYLERSNVDVAYETQRLATLRRTLQRLETIAPDLSTSVPTPASFKR